MTIGDGTVLGFAVSPAFARDGTCFVAHEQGLLKTADRGRTWQSLYGDAGEPAAFPTTAVAVSPAFAQDGVVFAAVPGGIGRSTDAGAAWRFVRLPEPAPTVSAIACSPDFGRDARVFVGTTLDGVLRTDDGGESWQPWNAGLLDHEVLSLAVSPAFPSDGSVFAGTGTGLFLTRNGGRRWSPCGHDEPGEVAILSLAVAADGTLFAGTEGTGLWRSGDLGESWRRLAADALPDDIQTVAITPTGRVLVFGEGSIARSDEGGETWRVVVDHPEDEIGALVAALNAE